MDPGSRPRKSDDVLAQRAHEELVLLNPQSGEYFSLDEVGARVWELCDGTRTLAEIVHALVHEYDAPADAVRRDVVELVGDLEREGLVSRADVLR